MKARYVAGLLVALFALLTLLDRFVLIELLVRRVSLPLLFACVAAVACIGVGALARRAARVDLALDFLIGYPLFGALCFLVALLKISAWTMAPLLIVGALAGVRLMLVPGLAPLALPRGNAALLAIVAVFACAFVAAQAPPASLDEVAYHLAVPHTWALEGRAVELPLLSHSYFPLGIESADLPFFAFGDDGVASHLLHLFAAIVVALLLARRTESWLAVAAIVTTPALAVTAGWSLVDWPLVGLFLALWLADDDWTASAATAAGLLVKYTFAPFALVVWAIRRRVPRWIAFAGLVFFVRNLVLTGNPIAPFFSAGAPAVTHFRDVALADYVFSGTFLDESIGACLLALAPFAAGIIPLAVLALAIALFLLGPSSRILVPYLVVPAASGAPALQRRLLMIVVSVAVVVQTFFVVWFTARGDAFSLLAGGKSEEEYLRRQRPSYAATEWLNTVLPPHSRTLVIGSGETYWFTRRVRGGGNFDGARVSRYLDVPTAEALRERLRRDGITHVAVLSVSAPATKDERKEEERDTTLSPNAQKLLVRMLDQNAASLMSRGNATLFTLR
ncbi:MAG: hypothetical protein JO197_19855 [Acidobacteria bacterium]|nr:hypothetical protein [Acidobacteriota bacterium]MBV9478615.1 hypothetical protein [Acidobacteriota bacterium]